jgi:hypothetical protein
MGSDHPHRGCGSEFTRRENSRERERGIGRPPQPIPVPLRADERIVVLVVEVQP